MLFHNHKYELINHGNAEYHVRLYREQRLRRYDNMKQPVPAGAIMGLDLTLNVKHLGKPASGHLVSIFNNEEIVYSGQLNENGYIYGIPMLVDHKCHCVPTGLSNTTENCEQLVDMYTLEVRPPEASLLTSSASDALTLPQ